MSKINTFINITKKSISATEATINAAKTVKEVAGNIQHNKDNNYEEKAYDAEFNSVESLYDYCVKRGFGEGTTKKWAIKHFTPIFNIIQPNETIYLPFIGLLNYEDSTHHDGTYTFLVTDKRILIGKKVVLGEGTREVKWENINDIAYDKGLFMGTLLIRTYNVTIAVGVNKNALQDIYYEMNKVFNKLKEEQVVKTVVVNDVQENPSQNSDPYEELKKLKELLDMGIISQEEFDTKKKELLGL